MIFSERSAAVAGALKRSDGWLQPLAGLRVHQAAQDRLWGIKPEPRELRDLGLALGSLRHECRPICFGLSGGDNIHKLGNDRER